MKVKSEAAMGEAVSKYSQNSNAIEI